MDDGAQNGPQRIKTLRIQHAIEQLVETRRIIQESGSAFQIGSGNAPEQADGVS